MKITKLAKIFVIPNTGLYRLSFWRKTRKKIMKEDHLFDSLDKAQARWEVLNKLLQEEDGKLN